MKIDNSLKGVSGVRPGETRRKKSDDSAATAGGHGTRDSVELTETSAKLSALEAALADIGATDAGKVEAIRQAIAEGRFKVDEEAVADALVKDILDQLSRQSGK